MTYCNGYGILLNDDEVIINKEIKMSSPFRQLRKRLQLTQREMAKLCKTTSTTISNSELGHSNIPLSAYEPLKSIGIDVQELIQLQKEFVEDEHTILIKRLQTMNLDEKK